LSIAMFNKRGDKDAAKVCYQKALAANPHDPRLLMEHDQLYQRLGASQPERLAVFECHTDLVDRRDDLSVNFAALYNQTGQPETALKVLLSHQFHPWEGGEGQAATQFALANALLGQAALGKGKASKAIEYFDTAQHLPASLGVGRAMPAVQGMIFYKTGLAYEALDKKEEAKMNYEKVLATDAEGAVWQPYSGLTYYAALALKKLGKDSDAETRLQSLRDFAMERLNAEDEGGFYTSIPATLIFEAQPGRDTKIWCNYLIGLANKGLSNLLEARQAFEAVLALDLYNWEAQQELSNLMV
jgi:tetratricopeptide (TPR) repeat protein